MESQVTEGASPETKSTLCVNCHLVPYEAGYPIKLCADCRRKLINYPIPKWIKLFALGILAVIVLSLVRTQKYIAVAAHLGRGEKAIEQKLYVTAQREIALVLAQFPDDVTANADMLIASAYNLDMPTFRKTAQKIGDKQIEDADFMTRITEAISYMEQANPKDTLTVKELISAAGNKAELMKLHEKIDTLNNDPAIKIFLANQLYDVSEYGTCEKLLDSVLKTDPEFTYALRLMSATERQLGKYDAALACCDRMLTINKEDIYAISQKARIELKRKHDAQAAVYAKQAVAIDPTDDSALESMAMVDHYAGRSKDCLASLATITKHAVATHDSTILNRLSAIINGTTIYR